MMQGVTNEHVIALSNLPLWMALMNVNPVGLWVNSYFGFSGRVSILALRGLDVPQVIHLINDKWNWLGKRRFYVLEADNPSQLRRPGRTTSPDQRSKNFPIGSAVERVYYAQ